HRNIPAIAPPRSPRQIEVASRPRNAPANIASMHKPASPKRTERKYMVEISTSARFTTMNVAPHMSATRASARSACQRAGDFFEVEWVLVVVTLRPGRTAHERYLPQRARPAPAKCVVSPVRGPQVDTTLDSYERRHLVRLLRSRSPEIPSTAEHWRPWKRNQLSNECLSTRPRP